MVELVQQHPSGGYILDELHVGMAAEKIRFIHDAKNDAEKARLERDLTEPEWA